MDFYFAGVQHKSSFDLMVKLGADMLKSYYTDKKELRDLIALKKSGEWKGKLLVDSGAYTCWTSGITVNVDKYIEYINENCEWVDYFIQLDTIPGTPHNVPTKEQCDEATEKSWENYLYMLDKVKCPEKIIPVYHKGEPITHLIRIIEHEHNGVLTPYICIGGAAKDRYKSRLIPWYHTCLDAIHKSTNPNIKIHALGQSIRDLLETMPFYSCDSTAWIQCNACGSIFTPWGNTPVSRESENLKTHINYRQPVLDWALKKCEQYGLDFEDVRDSYRFRALFNVHYTFEWANTYQYKGIDNFKRKKLF